MLTSLNSTKWTSGSITAVPEFLFAFLRYMLTDWIADFPLYDIKPTIEGIVLPAYDLVSNLTTGILGLSQGLITSPSTSILGSVTSALP